MSNPPKRPAANNQKNAPNKGLKNAGFVMLVVIFGLIILANMSPTAALKEISLSQAVKDANSGQYDKILVKNNELDITKKGDDKPTLKAYMNSKVSLKEQGFKEDKFKVQYKPETSGTPTWLGLVETIVPVLIIGGFLVFMMRSAQGQGNQALSFEQPATQQSEPPPRCRTSAPRESH